MSARSRATRGKRRDLHRRGQAVEGQRARGGRGRARRAARRCEQRSRRRRAEHGVRWIGLRAAIHPEAQETLLITAGLVILIIFLFLATLRATIIPALAIPVSIIATFAILAALGYSINTFTLLGLILAIGIVVDDAIIVLENAYRHQEELHKDPETAAIDGTREITTAVIATTIALVAVFSPLLS